LRRDCASASRCWRRSRSEESHRAFLPNRAYTSAFSSALEAPRCVWHDIQLVQNSIHWVLPYPSSLKVITHSNHFDYVRTERDSFRGLHSNYPSAYAKNGIWALLFYSRFKKSRANILTCSSLAL
jgi:hypothetical protein